MANVFSSPPGSDHPSCTLVDMVKTVKMGRHDWERVIYQAGFPPSNPPPSGQANMIITHRTTAVLYDIYEPNVPSQGPRGSNL